MAGVRVERTSPEEGRKTAGTAGQGLAIPLQRGVRHLA